MSQSKNKIVRREVRKNLAEQREKIGQHVEQYLSQLDQILKPNPWFIPAFVWVSLQKIFLNI